MPQIRKILDLQFAGTSSRQIIEVKHRQTRLGLGWVTVWEYRVIRFSFFVVECLEIIYMYKKEIF